jgi:hypothetical protein
MKDTGAGLRIELVHKLILHFFSSKSSILSSLTETLTRY